MRRVLVGLFLALSIAALPCWRRPDISLHGFFGDKSNIPEVRELLPDYGRLSPLPNYWKREVPLESYGGDHFPFYLDPEKNHVPPGEDYRSDYGIESSTLAFYVGEGNIDGWLVPGGQEVSIGQVHIGDGALRYLWLHSCRVMAHGPKVGIDYTAPQSFKADKRTDIDVFRRWTPAFGPRLRMVCGGSTFLGYSAVGEIWNYLLEAQTTVSDAFVLGLVHDEQVPVCLARGGSSPASSALADRTLQTGGVKQADWLHLQIPVRCKVELDKLRVTCGGESPPPTADAPATQIETLPRVATKVLPPPVPPEEGRQPLGFVPLPGKRLFKYHPASGAVVLIKSHDRYALLKTCDQVTTWDLTSWTLLSQKGLKPGFLPFVSPDTNDSRNFSDVLTALEMRVESRQDGALVQDRKCWVRSLFVRLDSEVDIGTQRLPIFGPGITLEIPRGKTPALASFSAPQRKLTVLAGKPHQIRAADTVIVEAQQELQLNPEMYPTQAAEATLGYEEAPLSCRQKFLRPSYEIRFVPTAAAAANHPTVIVRRDARINSGATGWECGDWDE